MRNMDIIRWCYKKVYSPLPADWIATAMKENKFNPCYGHYRSLEQIAQNHTYPAVLEGVGKEHQRGEVINMLEALRAGKECDAVEL
jgi:hypothetical protein